MAEKKISLLYLKAMEEPQNESKEPGETGNAAVAAPTETGILMHTITNKRLAAAGYFEILNYYESLHLCD